MTDKELLKLLDQQFVLLIRMANSNPIYSVEGGKKTRRSLAWVVRTECEAALARLREHLKLCEDEGCPQHGTPHICNGVR